MRAVPYLFVALAACANRAQSEKTSTKLPNVEVGTAEEREGTRSMRAGGTVRAKEASLLGFKVGGVVARVGVESGAKVRRGQMLATLDATEYVAGVTQAEEATKKYERDVQRLENLHREGAVPLADLEDAKTRLNVSRAMVRQVSNNAGRATLFAPDDGWISHRLVEPGQVVGPGIPVVRFESKNRGKRIVAYMVDRDALSLQIGQPCRAHFDAKPEESFACQVGEIARAASPTTGMIEVVVDPKVAGDWLEGLSAKVEFPESIRGVSVPLTSLVDESGMSAFVFLVGDDRRVHRVPVKVKFIDNGRAFLSEGIAAGAKIVSRGANALADGSEVAIEEVKR